MNRVASQGPVPDGARSFALPRDEVSDGHAKLIDNILRTTVTGLNMSSSVEDLMECPEHDKSYKTGQLIIPWCPECRTLSIPLQVSTPEQATCQDGH